MELEGKGFFNLVNSDFEFYHGTVEDEFRDQFDYVFKKEIECKDTFYMELYFVFKKGITKDCKTSKNFMIDYYLENYEAKCIFLYQ